MRKYCDAHSGQLGALPACANSLLLLFVLVCFYEEEKYGVMEITPDNPNNSNNNKEIRKRNT